MKLPDIHRPSVHGRFSYALHKVDPHDVLGYGNPNHWRGRRNQTGLCVVFGPSEHNKRNDLEHLRDILRNPALPDWIANGHNQLWFVQRRQQTVVSAFPATAPKLAQAPAGGGIAVLYQDGRQWKQHVWSYAELYKSCYNLEKIGSNCERCPHNGFECIYETIKSWAEQKGVDVRHLLPSTEPELIRIDDWDTEDIETFLRKVSARTPWEFVQPRLTVDHPFAPRLLQASELDFREVDTRHKERSDRSKRAMQTRKAVKRCEKECFFHKLCDYCEKPYFGRPHGCQVGERFGMSIPGPYSEEQAYDAAKKFWQSLPHIEREKIELVAYNAGLSTCIFGYELRLGRMTAEMDGVEFYRPTTGERRYMSFDDALLLCTTPYRYKGEYEYPEFKKPPEPMDDEEFYTYVEVCQHSWIRNRGYKQPHAPEILSVEWRLGGFKSETDKGFDLYFDDIRDIMKYNGGLPKTVEKFMRSKEEVGKDCPETNSDIQS